MFNVEMSCMTLRWGGEGGKLTEIHKKLKKKRTRRREGRGKKIKGLVRLEEVTQERNNGLSCYSSDWTCHIRHLKEPNSKLC